MNDFIMVQNQVLSPDFCAHVIDYFEFMLESGFGHTRKAEHPRYQKDDITIFPTEIAELDLNISKTILITLKNNVWDLGYKTYVDKFDIISALDTHFMHQVRVQKTMIGGGYHMWHCETSDRESSSRLLTYTLFLNTVDEGGETEFLYIPKRVKAEQGKLLLFPAGFTHTHRGNPPISNDKYIVTGWIGF